MFNQIELLPGAISDIFSSVTETGILTQGDRYGLLAANLNENLPENERRAVNRILRAVQRGRIQLATA